MQLGPGFPKNSYLRKFNLQIEVDARASRKSSIFLWRIVGPMFMRVNSKCAHQLRPPLTGGREAGSGR